MGSGWYEPWNRDRHPDAADKGASGTGGACVERPRGDPVYQRGAAFGPSGSCGEAAAPAGESEGSAGAGIFAVLLDGDFCGLAGCPPVDAERERFGLFFQLLPACWGRGVGRTAAALALTSLRRSFPAARVLADAAAENTASIRILEGLGFCRTAVHPGALRRSGESWDVWDYRLRCGG